MNDFFKILLLLSALLLVFFQLYEVSLSFSSGHQYHTEATDMLLITPGP